MISLELHRAKLQNSIHCIESSRRSLVDRLASLTDETAADFYKELIRRRGDEVAELQAALDVCADFDDELQFVGRMHS